MPCIGGVLLEVDGRLVYGAKGKGSCFMGRTL